MPAHLNPATGKELKAWKPIEDLPASWPEMRHSEIPMLAGLWRERRDKMEDLNVVKDFHARMTREWAIETGILERLYDIDRGTTVVLIERGIDATLIPHGATNRDANEVVALLRDHVEVSEGLFQFVGGKQPLSTFYIRQLHQVLTRHQASCSAVDSLGNLVETQLLKGAWKQLPNNPSREGALVHEYCPPEHVQSEMDRLVAMHEAHSEVDPLVEAAFLHHRFTQIHPFQDGNGRVARCLANVALLKKELQPLVLTRDDRASYISALELADEGELRPLVSLFALVEKRAFLRALSLSTAVIDSAAGLATIIKAAAAKERERSMEEAKSRLANELMKAERLLSTGRDALQSLAEQFNSAFAGTKFSARVQQSDEGSEFYFRAQIINVAMKLNYFANLSQLKRWVRVTIKNGFKTDIVLSFHKVGHDPSELLGCSAFVFDRSAAEDHEYPAEPACVQPFLFTTALDSDELLGQFKTWLDGALIVAMEVWRRKLGA